MDVSLIFFSTEKYGCVTKTREIVKFISLINNSVTIGLSLLLLSIKQSYHQKQSIFCVFLFGLYCSVFCKYHPYHWNIQ